MWEGVVQETVNSIKNPGLFWMKNIYKKEAIIILI